jgi:hypothetical protein
MLHGEHMKRTVAKRSAASRKGWRNRKRAKEVRIPLVLGPTPIPDEVMLRTQWPVWMRRALPLPDYGT